MADGQLTKFVTRVPAVMQRHATIEIDNLDVGKATEGQPTMVLRTESRQSNGLASKDVIQTQNLQDSNITSGGQLV